MACGIFLDQGLNPCLLGHQGSLTYFFSYFIHTMKYVESQFPNQGLKLHPLEVQSLGPWPAREVPFLISKSSC